MKYSVSSTLSLGVAACCVAASVATSSPDLTPPTATAIPVELSSLAQPLDLPEAGTASVPLPDANVLDALDLPGAAGFISEPIYTLLSSLVNGFLNLVTIPLSWVGLSFLVWAPVNFVESLIATVVTISPVTAVDLGDLAGSFELPALPDLAVPDALGDVAQEASAALLSLLP